MYKSEGRPGGVLGLVLGSGCITAPFLVVMHLLAGVWKSQIRASPRFWLFGKQNSQGPQVRCKYSTINKQPCLSISGGKCIRRSRIGDRWLTTFDGGHFIYFIISTETGKCVIKYLSMKYCCEFLYQISCNWLNKEAHFWIKGKGK